MVIVQDYSKATLNKEEKKDNELDKGDELQRSRSLTPESSSEADRLQDDHWSHSPGSPRSSSDDHHVPTRECSNQFVLHPTISSVPSPAAVSPWDMSKVRQQQQQQRQHP